MAALETRPPTSGAMAYSKYSIVHVPHDEESIQKSIKPHREFRLLSLQLAPEAFISTYAREVAFTDDVWHDRLANPAANTFIAVEDSGQIASACVLLGPLLYGPDVLPALGNPWTATQTQSGKPAIDLRGPLHFRINGVFTLPEARRQGLSKALIEKAVEFAETQMPPSPSPGVVVTILVEAENVAATALYKKCGFQVVKQVDRVSPHPGQADSSEHGLIAATLLTEVGGTWAAATTVMDALAAAVYSETCTVG